MSRTARIKSAERADLTTILPMAYGLHRRHGDTSPGAGTRSNGRGQFREGRIGVPAPRRGNSNSAGASSGTARTRKLSCLDNSEFETPARRPKPPFMK